MDAPKPMMIPPTPTPSTPRASLTDALARLPSPPLPKWPEGAPFVEVMRHGAMRVELYVPIGEDRQTPHDQDELYVIVSGQGTFELEGQRFSFMPHDVIFVAKGAIHRFVEFSADFKTWVIFY